jgi:hypothetical protein
VPVEPVLRQRLPAQSVGSVCLKLIDCTRHLAIGSSGHVASRFGDLASPIFRF